MKHKLIAAGPEPKTLTVIREHARKEFEAGMTYTTNFDNFDKALQHFNIAIQLYPEYIEALIARVGMNIYFKNLTQAIADCDKVISIDPKHAIAYNRRGLVYMIQNTYGLAREDFAQAIKLDPTFRQAQINLNAANRVLATLN